MDYANILYDSVDNVTLFGIPYSFETVLMQKNFNQLGNIAKMMSLFAFHKWANTENDFLIGKKDYTNWHILKFIPQGRGKDCLDQILKKDQEEMVPDTLQFLMEKYPCINITCSNSFKKNKCDCGSQKAAYTCYDEEIPCSSLKESSYTGKFACLHKIR